MEYRAGLIPAYDAPVRYPRLFGCFLMLSFVTGCTSAAKAPSGKTLHPPARIPSSIYHIGESCRLTSVHGDTRGTATGPHSLVLVGEGLGVIRSVDDGRSFDSIDEGQDLHWPSITSLGGRVWVSWVRPGDEAQAVVSVLGRKLHPPVVVFSSSRNLIDTEIVARANGELLLFVSEVDGKPNVNRATYRLICFSSQDQGESWSQASFAVSGPWGINIEDPRAIERADGTILLAYEWEPEEKGPSRILIQSSKDGGRSWSAASVLWDGISSDREPGSFFQRNDRLYFVASSDAASHRSYSGGRLSVLSSSDGGKHWSRPIYPISERDQLSMGAIVLSDRILLASLRFYMSHHPVLYLYPLDPLGLWRLSCGPGD